MKQIEAKAIALRMVCDLIEKTIEEDYPEMLDKHGSEGAIAIAMELRKISTPLSERMVLADSKIERESRQQN